VWALNESLSKNSDDYTLNILCLDRKAKESFDTKVSKNRNIRTFFIEDLKQEDPILEKSSRNPPSYEALNVSNGDHEKAVWLQFLWSLSSYFSWYCLEHLDCEDILFIDADIFFFDDWRKIYQNLEDVSVGIVEHRCQYSPANGKYNVGIVYFKNNFDGYRCLSWWKNCLLFQDNQYYKTHGMCGDQKYLELFEELFDGVVVLDKYFAHLAPWNYSYHEYGGYGGVVWDGKLQNLMYCHFSNFKPNYKEGTYAMAPRHGLEQAPNSFIKKIYDEYFDCLKRVND
tara:strand:+ start:3380 stop:4231 length:852 start_codon:yes stop_codon:yes gene_type:complete